MTKDISISIEYCLGNFMGPQVDELGNFISYGKQRLFFVVPGFLGGRVKDKRFIYRVLLLLPEYRIVPVVKQGEADRQLDVDLPGLIECVVEKTRQVNGGYFSVQLEIRLLFSGNYLFYLLSPTM